MIDFSCKINGKPMYYKSKSLTFGFWSVESHFATRRSSNETNFKSCLIGGLI
ncbi:MAG: hypothetical protein ACTS4T_01325 [Candidatus Hodgkinia cicadicola]